MENRELARKASFKKSTSVDARRRRETTTLQIRKEKKDGQLAKRRAASTRDITSVNVATNGPITNNMNKADATKVPSILELPRLVALVRDPPDDQTYFEALRAIRRMLAVERNPPIKAVIDSDVLPYLVTALTIRNGTMNAVQFEALWALTNVASSQYTAEVVKAGAIPGLILCLVSNAPEVREQAAWCLGNIAGESADFRDMVLAQGAVTPLCQNLAEPANASLLGNVVWTVSNLLRGKPQPPINVVAPFMQHLVPLLHNPPNKDVLADVIWSFGYLCDGENSRIDSVMEHNVVDRLVQLLGSEVSGLVLPTVRCLGNFVSGTDAHTQAVLNAGILSHMKKLLTNTRKNIRKETCWAFSNIAAGTPEQIRTLFTRDACLSIVVDYALTAPWDIRKEALWAVCNIFTGGDDSMITTLASIDGLKAVCNALHLEDPSLVMVAVDALDKVLDAGKRQNDMTFYEEIDECEGVEQLEKLQEHANDAIYAKVVLVIDKHYGHDEEEDENLAPAVDGDTFAFGMSSSPSKQLFTEKKSPSTNRPPLNQFDFGPL